MMKMNRFLAVMLSLCMVMTMLPLGVLAHEGTEKLALDVEQLSGVSVDLASNTINESELALVQEHVDANGMIDVFIVMEGESIIAFSTLPVRIMLDRDAKPLSLASWVAGT